MALADILARIETDASAEASAIETAAGERAESILEAARERAEAHAAQVLATAEHEAARDAETIVVNARLRGRDALVGARRQLIDEALAAAVEQVAALPDAEYALLLARRIADVARGGEQLRFGSLDSKRIPLVVAELKSLRPGFEVCVSDESAPFGRGALLVGDRVRVDLSLEALIEDRRDDLELAAAAVLFGAEA